MYLGAAVLGAALLAGTTAGAVTARLEIDRFGRSDLAGAHAARAGFLAGYKLNNLHVETFEGHAAWNGVSGTTDPKNTRVGSFSAYGKAGSGGSVVGDGAKLQVRGDNTMRWGRYNTENAPGGLVGGNWLDSNDNTGMTWDVTGLGPFNMLSFYVTDATDVGGLFSIRVGDTLFENLSGGQRLANGNIQLVTVLLDEKVSALTLQLMHNRTNDGFGVDGLTMANISPVPLPPAAALMVPGLLLLAGTRRAARRARHA
jgi:hypothetical protein